MAKEVPGHRDIKMALRHAPLAPAHKVKALEVWNETHTEDPTSHLLHSEAHTFEWMAITGKQDLSRSGCRDWP
jgi:hypothetical protein